MARTKKEYCYRCGIELDIFDDDDLCYDCSLSTCEWYYDKGTFKRKQRYRSSCGVYLDMPFEISFSDLDLLTCPGCGKEIVY